MGSVSLPSGFQWLGSVLCVSFRALTRFGDRKDIWTVMDDETQRGASNAGSPKNGCYAQNR